MAFDNILELFDNALIISVIDNENTFAATISINLKTR